METIELKKIWNTLAEEKLIDTKLAKDNILQIITHQGNGVISKLQRKHNLDLYVYLFIVVFIIPGITIFAAYRDGMGMLSPSRSGLPEPYIVLCLIEVFFIYATIRLKRNLNFIMRTYNTGTLKESLTNVRHYFRTMIKKGFWIGTISLISIFVTIEIFTLLKMGGIRNLNFSFAGPYTYESYFSILLMVLIICIPFIVKKDARKYKVVLQDLDQTIGELNEGEE